MDITPHKMTWPIAVSTLLLGVGLVGTPPTDVSHKPGAQPPPQEEGPVLAITKERQNLVFDADHDGGLDPGEARSHRAE